VACSLIETIMISYPLQILERSPYGPFMSSQK
jgi:hypothetical protein